MRDALLIVGAGAIALAIAAALRQQLLEAAGDGEGQDNAGGELAGADWPTTDAPAAGPDLDVPPDLDDAPRATLFDDLLAATNPLNYIPANVDNDTAARNERAFLDTIATSEGTAGRGDNGYNVLFGGATFTSYADHPRQLFAFTNRKGQQLKTSAAGRYQFIAPTWDEVRRKLQLPDFSPASQDAGALELVRRRGALNDVRAGRFATAIEKCRLEWASLPGAGYAQPERSFSELQSAYLQAGGTLST